MTKKAIRLIRPSKKYKDSYYEYVHEVINNGEMSELGNAYKENETFEQMLTRVKNRSQGKNLNSLEVPATIFWIIDFNNNVVGSIDLRHFLNENYFKRNGNVAYIIKPSERQKGYATIALNEALKKYREWKAEKILITCYKNNVASARTIEKNGGILKKEVLDTRSDNIIQRWWIYLK